MVVLQLEQFVLKIAHAGRLDAEIRFIYLPSNLVELGWLPFNFLGPTILLEIQIIVITRLARIFDKHQSHLGPKLLLEGAKSSLKFETSLLKSKFIQSLMVDNSLLNKLYGFKRLGLLWNLGMIHEMCNTAKRFATQQRVLVSKLFKLKWFKKFENSPVVEGFPD